MHDEVHVNLQFDRRTTAFQVWHHLKCAAVMLMCDALSLSYVPSYMFSMCRAPLLATGVHLTSSLTVEASQGWWGQLMATLSGVSVVLLTQHIAT
jgi:hypothetical protein